MASQYKIFTGGILTETNTFAPYPTGMATFKEMLFLRRGEAVNPPSESDPCHAVIQRGQELGWEVVAGLRAFAPPRAPLEIQHNAHTRTLCQNRACMSYPLQCHGCLR